MKRTFVAVKTPVEKDFCREISRIKGKLNDCKIKWVPTTNMHITLKFIGDTTEKQINTISETLKNSVKKCRLLEFEARSLGCFPSTLRPKVLWVGIYPDKWFSELSKKINDGLDPICVKEEKSFHPHITLGRIKYISNKTTFLSLIDEYKKITFQDFTASELVLFESILSSRGPVYKPLETFPFP